MQWFNLFFTKKFIWDFTNIHPSNPIKQQDSNINLNYTLNQINNNTNNNNTNNTNNINNNNNYRFNDFSINKNLGFLNSTNSI
jgi:hypothetical protein